MYVVMYVRYYLSGVNACVCVCAWVCFCVWLPAEQQAHGGKPRKNDTDAMCWHVPSGGFGVVVILLFSYSSPLVTPHIIQILCFKVP